MIKQLKTKNNKVPLILIGLNPRYEVRIRGQVSLNCHFKMDAPALHYLLSGLAVFQSNSSQSGENFTETLLEALTENTVALNGKLSALK